MTSEAFIPSNGEQEPGTGPDSFAEFIRERNTGETPAVEVQDQDHDVVVETWVDGDTVDEPDTAEAVAAYGSALAVSTETTPQASPIPPPAPVLSSWAPPTTRPFDEQTRPPQPQGTPRDNDPRFKNVFEAETETGGRIELTPIPDEIMDRIDPAAIMSLKGQAHAPSGDIIRAYQELANENSLRTNKESEYQERVEAIESLEIVEMKRMADEYFTNPFERSVLTDEDESIHPGLGYLDALYTQNAVLALEAKLGLTESDIRDLIGRSIQSGDEATQKSTAFLQGFGLENRLTNLHVRTKYIETALIPHVYEAAKVEAKDQYLAERDVQGRGRKFGSVVRKLTGNEIEPTALDYELDALEVDATEKEQVAKRAVRSIESTFREISGEQLRHLYDSKNIIVDTEGQPEKLNLRQTIDSFVSDLGVDKKSIRKVDTFEGSEEFYLDGNILSQVAGDQTDSVRKLMNAFGERWSNVDGNPNSKRIFGTIVPSVGGGYIVEARLGKMDVIVAEKREDWEKYAERGNVEVELIVRQLTPEAMNNVLAKMINDYAPSGRTPRFDIFESFPKAVSHYTRNAIIPAVNNHWSETRRAYDSARFVQPTFTIGPSEEPRPAIGTGEATAPEDSHDDEFTDAVVIDSDSEDVEQFASSNTGSPQSDPWGRSGNSI